MKKELSVKFPIVAALLAAAVVVLVLPGCSFDEDLTASLPSLYPATGLQAASLDTAAVLLTWNPSPSESDSRFQSYKLFWTYANAADSSLAKPDSVVLPRGTSSYAVTGLKNGVEYIFILYVQPENEVVQIIPNIRWAPSSVFKGIDLPAGSILALYDTTRSPAGPSVLESFALSAQPLGDCVLGSDGVLRSASSLGSGWRQTLFSTVRTPASSGPVPLPSFPAVGSFTDTSVVVQPLTTYYCRTQDGHFARIVVGNINEAPGGPSVSVDVSFQTRDNLPFASRKPR